MSSFFGRLKANSSVSSPTNNASLSRKDASATPQSPIEALLLNAGPVRTDGSDKFFGMQNPSNTCYCNSVVQCLYYSELFREKVINFPSHPNASQSTSHAPRVPELTPIITAMKMGSPNPASPPGKAQTDTPKSPQRFTSTPSTPSLAGPKPDETNKESFDYQKKMAVQTGPFFEITYDNSAAYGMETSLFTGLKDIFEAIVAQRSRFGVIALNRFLQTLREGFDTFRTPLHQDAHEFLNLLLNEVVTRVTDYSKSIQNDTHSAPSATEDGTKPADSAQESTPASTSWVHELFEGTLTSETRCLTCETISQRDEVFLDLSVDLDDHSSVTSCLRRFSEEEMLCERNKFHCDRCSGLQEAEKRMKIKRLPRILALHLKRFKYTEELGRLQKLFHRVVFPFHLRLFNTTDDAEDPDRLYELYAIIVHLGSTPFHGHYVSIIKTKDRGWLLFDDELVLPVDKNYVRNFFGGDPRNPACAYVLFYQETTMEQMRREQDFEQPEAFVTANHVPESVPHSPLANGNLSVGADHLGISTSPVLADSEVFASLDNTVNSPLSATRPEDGNLATFQNAATGVEPTDVDSNEVASSDGKSDRKETDKADASAGAKDQNHHVKTGSFSRFRPSNLSIRQKNKQKNSSVQDAVSNSEATDNLPPLPSLPTEKSKSNRFSLGKKKT